ncbi:MAG: hypothetical protein IMW86_06065 [Hydrogenibacillus sp.]|nr:hypothetical protein [Hydrogenibacillus sp.]
MEGSYQIRGAILTWGDGRMERRDLTVVDGRIYDFGGALGRALSGRIIDAPAGSVIRLGALYDGPLWHGLADGRTYRRTMAALAAGGYTAFVDWVRFDRGDDLESAVRYVKALHDLSPFDYTLKLHVFSTVLSLQLFEGMRRLELLEAVVAVVSPPPRTRFFPVLRDLYDDYPFRLTLYVPKGCASVEEILLPWYNGLDEAGIYFRRKYSTVSNDGDWLWSGLYGPKGRMAPGADADFVLYQPDRKEPILHLSGWVSENGRLPFGRGRFLRPRPTFAPLSKKQLDPPIRV